MSAMQGKRNELPVVRPTELVRRLMFEDMAFFMSQLVDVAGQPLQVAAHHRAWCRLITESPRLVLLAPRDHSKTTVGLVYLLWQFFRHATDPATGHPRKASAGSYVAVLFSATREQARVPMTRFRDLLAANAWLFPEAGDARAGLARPVAASETQIRLGSGAELLIRAYGTSTRGLHPDLLLLDDVLNDQNSGSEHQRKRTWHYFVATLLPMHATRILVVGTAVHAADLLHRLSPRSATTPGGQVHGFAWRRYRALDEHTETALWPDRHPYAELARIRDMEPTMFSREYQSDPRDELATYFPRSLTQLAVDAGATQTMLPWYHKEPGEYVVLGADLARSERIGADYTVAIVAVFDPSTGLRRVLTARRERGFDFEAQLDLFTDLAHSYSVDVAFIEDNGFQNWLLDELRKRPGGGVFFGHTTMGSRRMRLDADGIPILKLALVKGSWIVPSGDEASRSFARIWQAELAAFGWRDGRVEGVGEHDDVVVASWYVELAVRAVVRWLATEPEEIVTMEDLGIERVRIGPDF